MTERTRLFEHYALMARVGHVEVLMHAYQCEECKESFHIDARPRFCPNCGRVIAGVRAFSNRQEAAA